MSLRIPDLAAKLRRNDFLYNPLDAEILAEKASSLGHHGRQVERALAALRNFDAEPGDTETRRQLVANAAQEVWAFFVQRELCGLRNHKDAIVHYGIPNEVLARLGAIEKRQR
jgi:hypothetical protein